jgi:hypothetical protein
MTQELMSKVLYQIEIDIKNWDISALEQLIRTISEKDLKEYLPESYRK